MKESTKIRKRWKQIWESESKMIAIGTEGEQQKAEKKMTKIVFSCQILLLSHDRVWIINVTLAGNTIKWDLDLF